MSAPSFLRPDGARPGSWREVARGTGLDPARLIRALGYQTHRASIDGETWTGEYLVEGGSETYWVQLDEISTPPCSCPDTAWRGEEGFNLDGSRRPLVVCSHVLAVLIFLEEDPRVLHALGRAVRHFSLQNRLLCNILRRPVRQNVEADRLTPHLRNRPDPDAVG